MSTPNIIADEPMIFENPILNSSFTEPSRHFIFDELGITNRTVGTRRTNSYYMPIARTNKKSSQLLFSSDWTAKRIEECRLGNEIRRELAIWPMGEYVLVTPRKKSLLLYWIYPTREEKMFHHQIQILKSAIYLADGVINMGESHLTNKLTEIKSSESPRLFRLAYKGATGAGKTVKEKKIVFSYRYLKLKKFPNSAVLSRANQSSLEI